MGKRMTREEFKDAMEPLDAVVQEMVHAARRNAEDLDQKYGGTTFRDALEIELAAMFGNVHDV